MTPKEQEIRERISAVTEGNGFSIAEGRVIYPEDITTLLSIIDSLRAEKDEAQGLLLLHWHGDLTGKYLEEYLIKSGIILLKASATL